MFVQKNFPVRGFILFTGRNLWPFVGWTVAAWAIHDLLGLEWLLIPWLPLSVIGTATAFYVGFKNNQAYDRLWEARKIWGAIVNDSRAWGSSVRGYVSNYFSDSDCSEEQIRAVHQEMIKAHVAWLYQLREQLLVSTPWEHVNQRRTIKRSGAAVEANKLELEEYTKDISIEKLLPKGEYQRIKSHPNMATSIIDMQSQTLAKLHGAKLIDDFRHIALQDLLNLFYTHQGKCERIKKFPLPRQYGNTSIIMVCIFLLLLPFGMMTAFADMPTWGALMSVPFTIIVGWAFILMEMVGDYSENPFEGLGNDIPMLNLCRTIERDLMQMIDAPIPRATEAKNGLLM